jgi:hypothetical protein
MLQGFCKGCERKALRNDIVAPENAALRDRHSGRRCFVIGNGPSLRNQDLGPLKDEIVIVSNFFNLHPLCEKISPRYWCFSDPTAFRKDASDPEDFRRNAWYEDIHRRAPATEVMVPWLFRKSIEENGWFRGHHVWYIWLGRDSTELDHADSDLTAAIPSGQGTIPGLAIPAAIYMGFSRIFLLGCDCNFWLPYLQTGNPDMEAMHFYEQNPFYANRRAALRVAMEINMLATSNHFKSYRLLRDHAERRGVRILNATAGGILDVFERCSLEDALRT